MTPGIYELLLRAPDGRERRTLVWLPNEAVRRDYFDKTRKRGLTVEILTTNKSYKEYGNEANIPFKTETEGARMD